MLRPLRERDFRVEVMGEVGDRPVAPTEAKEGI